MKQKISQFLSLLVMITIAMSLLCSNAWATNLSAPSGVEQSEMTKGVGLESVTPTDTPTISGACGVNLTWVLDNAGVLTISGSGSMSNFTPSSVPWNSYLSKIDLVVIENGVISIGDYAFYQCIHLANITIPTSVGSIGTSAFAYCEGLTTMALPNSVTNIGDSAFAYCEGLTTMALPNSVINIGDSAFKNCISLNNINIPESVTALGSSIFYGCQSLKSIVIPDNVQSLGSSIFYGCQGLKSIVIPDNVQSLGSYAFYNCYSLQKVQLSSQIKEITPYAFYNCKNLQNIELPSGIIGIDEYAFYLCNKLENIKLPEGLQYIKDYAFMGSGLTSIVLPNGITNIPSHSFEECRALTSIKLGNQVEKIGSCAFLLCGKLNSITIPESVKTIGQSAFSNLSTIYFIGNAPIFNSFTFQSTTRMNACYPINNATWTASVLKNYGGDIHWIPWDGCTIPISVCTLKLSDTTYDGHAKETTIAVKNGSTLLINGLDYIVTYENNLNAGTATVIIAGINNYSGTISKTFTIMQASQTITAEPYTKTLGDKAFNLGAKTNGGGKLTYKSSDTEVSTVSSSGQITLNGVGTTTITITAAATTNYKETTKTVVVVINPKCTSLSSVKNLSGKKMAVIWNKNTAVTGYQIEYSVFSKFSSPKTLTVKSYKTTRSTISKLTKNKKYYVRIRTYKTVSKVNYYSAWSGSKNVTI